MPITVACACGKRLHTAEKNAGRSTKCPNCGAEVTFTLPAAPPEPAPSFDRDFECAPPEKGFDIAPADAAPDLGPLLSGIVDPVMVDPNPPKAPTRPGPRPHSTGGPAPDPWFFQILTAY